MSGARDRPVAPLSSDPGAARVLNALWKFLERTGLQRFVEGLCVETLRGPQSPRNPYPAFINRAREQAERYRLAESTTAEKFLSDVSFQTSPTAVRYIAGPVGDPFSGANLQEVMSALEPQIGDSFQKGDLLQTYRWGTCNRITRCSLITTQRHTEAVLSGYQEIVKRTLQHPSSLSPPGLWERVLQLRPAGSAWLQHVSAACQCLSDSVAWELHSLCPEISTLLGSVGRERVRERLHSAAAPPPGEEVSPRHAELSRDTKTHPTAQQALDNW
ncbi:UNVERIFIED_CONTAM: hypothetical protein FKN15_072179 [Acipenser sinensis]